MIKNSGKIRGTSFQVRNVIQKHPHPWSWNLQVKNEELQISNVKWAEALFKSKQ
jgi:hypothetical protein